MKKRILSTLLALCTVLALLPGTALAASSGIHYYLVFQGVAETWEEALLYCESVGGHLATITSKAENDYVYKLMRNAGYTGAYLGLTDKDEDGVWEWVTGEAFVYQNWHPGEPNNDLGSESYGMFFNDFRDGTWNDSDFNGKTDHSGKAFICEWETQSAFYAYLYGTPSTYTITFNPYGGRVSTKTKTVTNGNTYGDLPIPIRSGYTFKGWYTETVGGNQVTPLTNVELSADQTLYARWTQNPTTKTYTIKLDANSGKVSPSSIKVQSGKTYYSSLPTPTRTGYKFAGWYTAKSGGTQITSTTKATKNQTIYAHWTSTATSSTYTITLNANGGKVSPASLKVASGKTYYSSLPTPTRSGYKFNGWYTSRNGGVKITSTSKATANCTIYAHWTPVKKTYLVTFDANGGMVHLDRKVVPSGVLYRDLPTPTKNNSHFQGWYTKKTGGTKVTANSRTNLTADQTLYARWQSSATVRSTQRGTYRVTIPAYYDLALYASSSTAKISSQPEITASQTITCTQRATLSNGTVRYYGKVNGKTGWFTYSCEMSTK